MHLDDLTTTSRVICTLEPKASDSRKLTAVSSCAPKQLLLESSDRFFSADDEEHGEGGVFSLWMAVDHIYVLRGICGML